MDVEDIHLPKSDLQEILNLENEGKIIQIKRNTNEKRASLPVKLMIGDGIDWLALITFPITRMNGVYSAKVVKVQPSIRRLIQNLPMVTGLGIKNDVTGIEETYSLISDEPVFFRGFVELEPLAAMAGYHLQARNMTAMSLNILGMAVNKVVSVADGTWGLPFNTLAKAFQIYANADIKFGFLTYNVLTYALHTEFFPDPEVICYLTSSTQYEFSEMFLEFILNSVKQTTTYMPEFLESETREQLIMSIKLFSSSGKVSKNVNTATLAMLNMKPQVPTITAGGPRYLHQAREWSLVQYQILREEMANTHPHMFERKLEPDELLYVRFGRLNLKECDNSKPITRGNRNSLLVVNEKYHDTLLNFEDMEFSHKNLLKAADDANRPLTELLLEWTRIEPQEVNRFFEHCHVDPNFAKLYKKVYEAMRLQYMRTTNDDPVVVRAMEDIIDYEHREAKDWVNQHINQLQEELEIMKNFQKKINTESRKGRNADR